MEQREQRRLAGLAPLLEDDPTGWSYPFHADEDGVAHVDNFDVRSGDQKSAVKNPPAAEPDFPTRLAQVVKSKTKQSLEILLPISETSWVGLEPTTRKWFAVNFTRSADGAITVTTLEDLAPSIAKAAASFRDAIKQRVAAMNGTAVKENQDLQAILLENRARMRQLAGIA